MWRFFYCQDDLGRSGWHRGRIQDAGIGGLRVKANRIATILRGRELETLCLPDADQTLNGQEPVRIHGRVVWQDGEKQNFGLEYR